jgi:dynein heavy chain 2
MINSLIVSGEIPGLFSLDELDRLPVADDLKKDAIGKSLQEVFCERVSQNLKIVLSMDHKKEGFFEICASNPALYTCNIIWFDNLNSSSLRSIGSEYLTKELPDFSRATIDDVGSLCCEVHKILE